MNFHLALGCCLLLALTGCVEFNPVPFAQNNTIEQALQKYAHGNLQTKEAQVLLDNEKAYQSKLRIIRSAISELRLSYYIFSDDQSSAYLVDELLKAARRGVKIKILTDLSMEFANLDYFSMLVEKGMGNIEIRFYGRPGREVMKDVVYLTSACPPSLENGGRKELCYAYKDKEANRIFEENDTA
ncbi:MAG: phospholipase D-like domain-containing protein, partial [Pseudomonadota bacterium]